MLDTLNKDPELPLAQILQQVRTALEDFVGDIEQFDDLTMMCIEYKGRRLIRWVHRGLEAPDAVRTLTSHS